MRGLRPWLFVAGAIGFVSGLAVEIAAVVLLYAEPGFLRAASVVFGTQATGFALGLLSVGVWRARSGATIEQARGWWFLAMISYSLTAAFTGAWTVGAAPPAPATQALGLALLAALPQFAAGGLFGVVSASALSGADRAAGSPFGYRRADLAPRAATIAGFAWLGGAAAIVLGGVLLPRVPPFTLLLLCMVVLATGALLHGRALERRPFVSVLEEGRSAGGATTRVEEWSTARGERRIAVVREDRGIVAWDPEAGGVPLWVGVVKAVLADTLGPHSPGRIAFLGAQLWVPIRPADLKGRDYGAPEITVVEPVPEYLRLLRVYLGPVDPEAFPMEVVPVAPVDLAEFDLVVAGPEDAAVLLAGAEAGVEVAGEAKGFGATLIVIGTDRTPIPAEGRRATVSYRPRGHDRSPFEALGDPANPSIVIVVPEHRVDLTILPDVPGFDRGPAGPPIVP